MGKIKRNTKKIKTVFLLFIMLIFVSPIFTRAANNDKNLVATNDNKSNVAKLRSTKTKIEICSADQYPVPFFIARYGKDFNFEITTDKETYNAGDTVKLTVLVKNPEGFIDPGGFKKGYLIWGGGNIFAKLNRINEEPANGDFLIALGYLRQDSDILLSNGQKTEFNFEIKTPSNLKNGTYEIALYPTSGQMMSFKRRLEGGFEAPLATRVKIMNSVDKEEKIKLDPNRVTLNGETINTKEKIVYLGVAGNSSFAIPVMNSGQDKKKLGILKRIYSLTPYGNLINEEREEVELEPNSENIIKYEINQGKLKDIPGALVEIRFIDSDKENIETYSNSHKNAKGYLNLSSDSSEGEGLTIPIWIKGNVGFAIKGMGIQSPEFPWKNDNWLVYFLEAERVDPLYFSSGQKERGGERNVSLILTLIDVEGNKVNEVTYSQPSWDRTIAISQPLAPKTSGKNYDYLKLVGTIKDSNGNELDRQELVYDAKNPSLENKTGLIDKGSEIVSKLKAYATFKNVVYVCLVILFLMISAVGFYIIRRKQKEDRYSNQNNQNEL